MANKTQLSQKQLNVVNNSVLRLVLVTLIVYLGFIDVVTAVLLLIAFVVTLHYSKNNKVEAVLGPKEESFMNEVNNWSVAFIATTA